MLQTRCPHALPRLRQVCGWFAARCDLILLLFDPYKLDISDEFKAVISTLRGHDDKARVCSGGWGRAMRARRLVCMHACMHTRRQVTRGLFAARGCTCRCAWC